MVSNPFPDRLNRTDLGRKMLSNQEVLFFFFFLGTGTEFIVRSNARIRAEGWCVRAYISTLPFSFRAPFCLISFISFERTHQAQEINLCYPPKRKIVTKSWSLDGFEISSPRVEYRANYRQRTISKTRERKFFSPTPSYRTCLRCHRAPVVDKENISAG